MNVYLPNGRLPSSYQEVEYIGSSGTQWIDTGVIPTSNTKSQMKVLFTAYTGDVVYGYYKGDDNNDYRFFNAYVRPNHDLFDLGRTTFDFSNQRITGNVGYFQLNTIYELELGNYYLKNIATGTNLVSGSAISSFTGTRTITLNNSNNTYYSKNKWYYVKIYDNGTLVRDFVPCYRKSDSVIGMYDLVNNQFYTNSGTGTFSKGNDVTMAELKNAYIGDVWTPNANTLLYLPFNGNYNDSMGNTMSLIAGTAPSYNTTAQGEQYANIGSKCCIGATLSSLDINNWTISQWIYKTSTTVDVINYFGGKNFGASGSTNGLGTGLFINNKRLTIFVWNTDIDTGVDITLNAWHNVIMTAQNGTTKIYVDGELKATKSYTYIKDTNMFSLLCNPYGTQPNKFSGRYDELIFESKVWDSAEILSYYNQTKGNYGL